MSAAHRHLGVYGLPCRRRARPRKTSSRISSARSSVRYDPASGSPSSRATPRSRSPSRRSWMGRCSSTPSSVATSASDGDAATCARRRRATAMPACESPDLNLKFVVHHGTILRQRVAGQEPLGPTSYRPSPAQERRHRIDGHRGIRAVQPAVRRRDGYPEGGFVSYRRCSSMSTRCSTTSPR